MAKLQNKLADDQVLFVSPNTSKWGLNTWRPDAGKLDYNQNPLRTDTGIAFMLSLPWSCQKRTSGDKSIILFIELGKELYKVIHALFLTVGLVVLVIYLDAFPIIIVPCTSIRCTFTFVAKGSTFQVALPSCVFFPKTQHHRTACNWFPTKSNV